jgi:hypothetical protein
MHKTHRICVTSFVLLLAACGGSEQTPAQPEPAPAPASAATTPEPAPAETPAWSAMTKEQRLKHMKEVVFPAMKVEFANVDADRYESMTCATCHGDGAKSGTFKMPNPDLPRLDPTNTFKKHMDKSPEMTKFMMEVVVPKMAEMLGTPAYDPATGKGFGCMACHLPAGK